jgi:hypothetical protein
MRSPGIRDSAAGARDADSGQERQLVFVPAEDGSVPRSFCSVREALDSTPTSLLALALDHKLFFYSGLYPPCDPGERHSDEAANFTRHDITVVYDVFAKVPDGMRVEIRDRAMRPSDRIKR